MDSLHEKQLDKRKQTALTKSMLINGTAKSTTSPPLQDFTSSASNLSNTPPEYLQLMREVYSRRISNIENNPRFNETQKTKQKTLVLESFVKHLYEQNDCFATTMVNLERECEHRVKEMEKRLKKSAKTTMEAVIAMHEYEKDTKKLVEERMYIESLYEEVKHQLTELKVENGFLRDLNSNLNHDVRALLHVIHHARTTGHWVLDCVTFCEVTPEQVFGPIQSISQTYAADAGSQSFGRDNKFSTNSDLTSLCNSSPYRSQVPSQGNTNFSPRHLYPSYIRRCASLPEIGNIYNFGQAVHKSNSYDNNDSKKVFRVKPSKHKSNGAGNTIQTPELLKDVSYVSNLEDRLCNRKSQSEPHLFMFDGNIYKYTPCEPIQKPSSIALNENYQSSLPPYQSIDLKFPTEDSSLKINIWNKLKSGSYLDDQENSYLKDNSIDISYSCSESDIPGLNFEMCRLLEEQSTSYNNQIDSTSVALQTETYQTAIGTQVKEYELMSSEELLGHEAHEQMNFEAINQSLQQDLNRALIHSEQKNILVGELQNHVNSAFLEVEQKNKVIENLERKLQLSRDDCAALRKNMEDVNMQLQNTTKHFEESRLEIEYLKTQMQQQASLIRSLQDALVHSKRALDAVSSTALQESAKSRKVQRSDIVDI